MSLVNLNGMTIFGAGSEWVWSMAQFILVAASILGIYFQLRAQRASSLHDQIEAWERTWNEERFVVIRLGALVDLDGRKPDQGLPTSSDEIGEFFERLGYLTAKKHLRSNDVWHSMRHSIGRWWMLMGPYLAETRKELENPALYEWFEKLEVEMRGLDRKEFGRVLTFGALDEVIGESIANLRAHLELQANARNGIYPNRRPQGDPPAEA
jgi:hypothetical protein